MTRRLLYATFWISVYLLLALAPLLVVWLGQRPPGRSFWHEFSVALGFIGLAMMGLQFFLTGRLRLITRPYGIDVVYHFHRQISLVAFALVLAHPILLFVTSPETLRWLNVFNTPWRMLAGIAAVLCLLGLISTSLWRTRLRLSYESWRALHAILAIGVLAFALAHIVGVSYYLSEPYKRVFWLGLGGAWLAALAYVRLIKPILLLRYPYTVEAVQAERGETHTVRLRPEGHKGLTFKPGEFAWLKVWSSPFSLRENPFSFSSSALRSEQVEISIKELGDFTRRIGSELEPGTRAYLDGPYGAFTLDNYQAPGYVFVAGGVGITPFMSMLRTLEDRHDARPILLFYGSQTWESVTFREELERLQQVLNLRVVHVLQNPPADWEGERGFVTVDTLARHLPAERLQYEYLLCGPPPMLNAVEQALTRLGIPLEQTQAERFNFV